MVDAGNDLTELSCIGGALAGKIGELFGIPQLQRFHLSLQLATQLQRLFNSVFRGQMNPGVSRYLVLIYP